MPIVDDELRTLFYKAVRTAQYASYTAGLMGRDDGGGSFTYDAASGDGQKYVRVLSGGVVTLARAINQAGVADTGDLPLWLDRGPDGRWIIVSERYTG